MFSTDEITDNFTFTSFKKFISCSYMTLRVCNIPDAFQTFFPPLWTLVKDLLWSSLYSSPSPWSSWCLSSYLLSFSLSFSPSFSSLSVDRKPTQSKRVIPVANLYLIDCVFNSSYFLEQCRQKMVKQKLAVDALDLLLSTRFTQHFSTDVLIGTGSSNCPALFQVAGHRCM